VLHRCITDGDIHGSRHNIIVRYVARGGETERGSLASRWCCAVLCCAVLCCAVLCCAVLCCAVICYAVLCCAGMRADLERLLYSKVELLDLPRFRQLNVEYAELLKSVQQQQAAVNSAALLISATEKLMRHSDRWNIS
jgi:hypothetical protein